MRVSRWGNSLAVRLPQSVVEDLALKEGEDIEFVAVGHRSFEVVRDKRKEEILARIRELSTPLPADFKFDRDEANER